MCAEKHFFLPIPYYGLIPHFRIYHRFCDQYCTTNLISLIFKIRHISSEICGMYQRHVDTFSSI